ncbi:hypothetical protein FJU30_09180 [Affinibrenneria salicis]|uniref:Uncharacterized protein n=1 Tax=Affinibrenneria salicis TaxID=2590031 RepID=A0A5J5G3H0_9GAMM|nr:hypothetical protein [Affinibrenneria salicis]KAA9001376.1 hypothetical protein FJU30_09180 [Affinibrenneria salicis]
MKCALVARFHQAEIFGGEKQDIRKYDVKKHRIWRKRHAAEKANSRGELSLNNKTGARALQQRLMKSFTVF